MDALGFHESEFWVSMSTELEGKGVAHSTLVDIKDVLAKLSGDTVCSLLTENLGGSCLS